MKILVAIKRVIDANVHVQLKRDGTDVATDGVKMSINPFDEIALEEALQIRDKNGDTEVVAVTIDSNAAEKQLRTALAMGADRAILVETNEAVQPLHAAHILRAVVEQEKPDLVFTGKQAIDNDNNQTGQMLAALWQRPQATFTSKLELHGNTARCTREVDAGLETIEVDLPAVVTTDLRLNQPRYVKMREIMKAKSKPLDTLALNDLKITQSPSLEITRYETPPEHKGHCQMVDSAAALVTALKEKGVL